jgi:hypothetical protein
METTSNRASNAREKICAAWRTYSTPPSPGPPGLKNNVPTRRRGLSARCLATLRLIVLPCGLDQSRGTFNLPHWATLEPGHALQEMADLAATAWFAAAPAEGTVAGTFVTPKISTADERRMLRALVRP